ncbi:hypothetical protein EJB05_21147, partial [Eragrostis curvula]
MLASAAAVLAAAAASAPVAAGQSPEAQDDPRIADLMTISIFMAVFFPVFIVLLSFACLRLFLPPDDDGPEGSAASASPAERSRRGPGGLDADAIAALPLVFYRDVRRHRIVAARDGDGDDALECSVCLLEFDDDDALRLLPTCPHAFHPECIGLWLERHATCPLCRASLLDAPPAPLQPVAAAPLAPDSPPDHPAVVLIGDRREEEEEEEEEWTRIQCLARNRRVAGRQALPRSNSTGTTASSVAAGWTGSRCGCRSTLRHVTSAVESVRVREGSAHGSTVGGSVRGAVARLLSLFTPGAGRKGDGDDKSLKADVAGASSNRRRENSSRGAVGGEKRSQSNYYIRNSVRGEGRRVSCRSSDVEEQKTQAKLPDLHRASRRAAAVPTSPLPPRPKDGVRSKKDGQRRRAPCQLHPPPSHTALPSQLWPRRTPTTRLVACRSRLDLSTSVRTCGGSRTVNLSWSPPPPASSIAVAVVDGECPIVCHRRILAARRTQSSLSSSTASSSSSLPVSTCTATEASGVCGGGSAAAAGAAGFSRLARHSGQVTWTWSHGSMQSGWNAWEHCGSSRSTSPSSNSARQTAHSSPPLRCFLISAYGRTGSAATAAASSPRRRRPMDDPCRSPFWAHRTKMQSKTRMKKAMMATLMTTMDRVRVAVFVSSGGGGACCAVTMARALKTARWRWTIASGAGRRPAFRRGNSILLGYSDFENQNTGSINCSIRLSHQLHCAKAITKQVEQVRTLAHVPPDLSELPRNTIRIPKNQPQQLPLGDCNDLPYLLLGRFDGR